MKGDRLKSAVAVIALIVGAGFLLLVSAMTWWSAFHEEPFRLSLDYALLLGALLFGAVLVEWPWRPAWARVVGVAARFLLVGIALFWLTMLFNTYSWVRSIYDWQRVTEFGGQPIGSEFMQGAFTLKRMADYMIDEASLPVLVLIWLAVLPGLRVAYEVLARRTNDPDRFRTAALG